MAAMPVVKLLYLGIRQLSKPIASIFKRSAVENAVMRQYVVMPIGQASHKLSVILKRLTLNSVRTDVKPLPDNDALQLGAEILGELFVYTIAATIMTREYLESTAKSQAKEEKLNRHLADMESRIQGLERELAIALGSSSIAAPGSAEGSRGAGGGATDGGANNASLVGNSSPGKSSGGNDKSVAGAGILSVEAGAKGNRAPAPSGMPAGKEAKASSSTIVPGSAAGDSVGAVSGVVDVQKSGSGVVPTR